MTLPLDGTLVLDLSHVLAGPFATLSLNRLGADVIKVERPGSGDPARGYPPFSGGKSAGFAAVNHGKKSIALDLKAEDDRLIFDRLLDRADVLVSSFRPGVMERMGLDWNRVHAVHPALIVAELSGYGQTGPDAKRRAYDVIAQGRGGLMALTGEDGAAPLRSGVAVADMAAALYLVQGILAALLARKETGRGQRVDVSLLDAQVSLLDHSLAEAMLTGKSPRRTGNTHPAFAPCGAFEAADGPFVLAAGNDRLFEKLCVAMNLDIARDPRFADNAARCTNARLLQRIIETETLGAPRGDWIKRLVAAGIPAGPIQGLDQLLRDPQVAARNMIVDVLDRHGRAAWKAAGNPVKLSEVEDRPTRPPAPDLDANRGEILRWLES